MSMPIMIPTKLPKSYEMADAPELHQMKLVQVLPNMMLFHKLYRCRWHSPIIINQQISQIVMAQIEPKTTNAGLLYHHINHTYQNMVNLVQQNSIAVQLDDEPTCKEKITTLENIIKQLISHPNKNISQTQPCRDCPKHESCIQKLEGQKMAGLAKIRQLQSKREEQKAEAIVQLKKELATLENQVVSDRYRLKNFELCLSACENEKKQLEIINQQLSQEITNLKKISIPQTPRIHESVAPLTERHPYVGKENGISIATKEGFPKEKQIGKAPSSSLSKRGIAVKSRPVDGVRALGMQVEHNR